MPSYKELMLKRKKKADSIQDQLRIEQLSSGKRSSPPKPAVTRESLNAALAKRDPATQGTSPPMREDDGTYSWIEEGRKKAEEDKAIAEKALDDYWRFDNWNPEEGEEFRADTGWKIEENKRRYGPTGLIGSTNDRIKPGTDQDFGESAIYQSATKGAALQLEAMEKELTAIYWNEKKEFTRIETFHRHEDKFDEYYAALDAMEALRDSYQLKSWRTVDPENPRMGGTHDARPAKESGKGHGVLPDALRKHPFIAKSIKKGWIDTKKLDTGRLAELRSRVWYNEPNRRRKEDTRRGYGNALYNKLIKAPLAEHELGNLKLPPPIPSVVGPKLKIPEPVMPPPRTRIDPETGLPEGGGGTLKMLKP